KAGVVSPEQHAAIARFWSLEPFCRHLLSCRTRRNCGLRRPSAPCRFQNASKLAGGRPLSPPGSAEASGRGGSAPPTGVPVLLVDAAVAHRRRLHDLTVAAHQSDLVVPHG